MYILFTLILYFRHVSEHSAWRPIANSERTARARRRKSHKRPIRKTEQIVGRPNTNSAVTTMALRRQIRGNSDISVGIAALLVRMIQVHMPHPLEVSTPAADFREAFALCAGLALRLIANDSPHDPAKSPPHGRNRSAKRRHNPEIKTNRQFPQLRREFIRPAIRLSTAAARCVGIRAHRCRFGSTIHTIEQTGALTVSAQKNPTDLLCSPAS